MRLATMVLMASISLNQFKKCIKIIDLQLSIVNKINNSYKNNGKLFNIKPFKTKNF